MENITAEIILDSVGRENEVRATTFLLTYPRFIHSEFMTHRVFSRNAASSRAIPTSKMLERVREQPATFEFWGVNEPGMQASQEMNEEEQDFAELWWQRMANIVANEVEGFQKAMKMTHGRTAHKQLINRALEPWLHMQTLVTSTEWDNFFELRDHPDAQPEFQVLARKMRDLYDGYNQGTEYPSNFQELSAGQWHLPYIRTEEFPEYELEDLLKISTARCARTSYFPQDATDTDPQKDIELHDRLVGQRPRHSSPAEHQLLCQADRNFYYNSRGFIQYRQFLDSDGCWIIPGV